MHPIGKLTGYVYYKGMEGRGMKWENFGIYYRVYYPIYRAYQRWRTL
jgi:hypothetical protein